jgi:SAM-dependent methyltransferase
MTTAMGTTTSTCDCGAPSGTVLARVSERRYGLPGTFELIECAGCRLVRTSPQPDDLGAYYPSAGYYAYQPPEPPSERIAAIVRNAYFGRGSRRRLAQLVAGRFCEGLPPGPPSELLDIGCGSGEFLLALREANWEVHGVEPDAGAVSAAHHAGLLNVRAGELHDQDYPPGRFGAVRFWHSLEHVPSPAKQLAEAHRVLRPGGSLTIGVPNFGSLLARRTGDQWFALDVPRHLWHFTRQTLRDEVERAGFEVGSLRLVSSPTTLLGTIDYKRQTGERLVRSRKAWYATLPLSVALDVAGMGDAIQLVAFKRP